MNKTKLIGLASSVFATAATTTMVAVVACEGNNKVETNVNKNAQYKTITIPNNKKTHVAFKLSKKVTATAKDRLSANEPLGGHSELYRKPSSLATDSNIDYSKHFQPFNDMGFNWYQFYTANGGGDMGRDLLERSHLEKGGVINLGFITATSAPAINNSSSSYAKSAKEDMEKNSDSVIPTIGGTMPLWAANFTTKGGQLGYAGNWDDEYNFLNEVRSHGLDYTVSFGGWNHDSLSKRAFEKQDKGYTPRKLAQLYKTVIEKLDLHSIDFDIEGTEDGRPDDNGLSGDPAKVNEYREFRLQALKLLRQDPDIQKRGLHISFTLPVTPNGLKDFNNTMIVKAFKENIIDKLFLMTMDYDSPTKQYGRSTIPGEMATLGISAINSVKEHMLKNNVVSTEEEAYRLLGFVDMIGVNDVKQEITTLTDSLIMKTFADAHDITCSMWSTLRDHSESSIAQSLQSGHVFDNYLLESLQNGTGRTQDAYNTGLPIKAHAYESIYSGDPKITSLYVSKIFFDNFKKATGADFTNFISWTKPLSNIELLTTGVSHKNVIDAFEHEMKQSSVKDSYLNNEVNQFIGKLTDEEKAKHEKELHDKLAHAKTWDKILSEPHGVSYQLPKGSVVINDGKYFESLTAITPMTGWGPARLPQNWKQIGVVDPSKQTNGTKDNEITKPKDNQTSTNNGNEGNNKVETNADKNAQYKTITIPNNKNTHVAFKLSEKVTATAKDRLSANEPLGGHPELYRKPSPLATDSNIDYNKHFQPFNDMGFNWYQFYTANGGGDMGRDLLERSHLEKGGVINLGFITATSAPAINNSSSSYAKSAKEDMEKNSDSVIPTIGGTMPLWAANFTTKGGQLGYAGNWDDEYNFLNEVRSHGLDYTVSFGGWNHDSLSKRAFEKQDKGYTPRKLAQLYKTVIEKLDLHSIDFDIEGTEDGRPDDNGLSGDPAKVNEYREFRLQALKLLRQDPDIQKRGLHISFTLPVTPNGLKDFNNTMIVKAFKENIIDKLFLMTMDYDSPTKQYGRSTIPGEMATLGISAINSVKEHMLKNNVVSTEEEAYRLLGFVDMIGVNDVKQEITTLTDSLIMKTFADAHDITCSMWSTLRDHSESSIAQSLQSGHVFDNYLLESLQNGTGRTQDAYNTGLPIKAHAYESIYSGDPKITSLYVSKIFFDNFKKATGADFTNFISWTKPLSNIELLTTGVSHKNVIDAFEHEMKQSSVKDSYLNNEVNQFIGKLTDEEKAKHEKELHDKLAHAKTWDKILSEPHGVSYQLPKGSVVINDGKYFESLTAITPMTGWGPARLPQNWKQIGVVDPSKQTNGTKDNETKDNQTSTNNGNNDGKIYTFDHYLNGPIEKGTIIKWTDNDGKTILLKCISKIWYATNQDAVHGKLPEAIGAKWQIVNKPAVDKPAVDKPAINKPAVNNQTVNKPVPATNNQKQTQEVDGLDGVIHGQVKYKLSNGNTVMSQIGHEDIISNDDFGATRSQEFKDGDFYVRGSANRVMGNAITFDYSDLIERGFTLDDIHVMFKIKGGHNSFNGVQSLETYDNYFENNKYDQNFYKKFDFKMMEYGTEHFSQKIYSSETADIFVINNTHKHQIVITINLKMQNVGGREDGIALRIYDMKLSASRK